MKVSFPLVLVFLFGSVVYANLSSAQDLLNKRVTIHAEREELKSVLHHLERSAKVRFTYTSSMVRGHKVSLDARDQSLEQVLNTLLTPLRIHYSVSDDFIILGKETKEPRHAPDQESIENLPEEPLTPDRSVKGKVTDEKGDGLPGVNIILKGTQQGTVTNADGTYDLSVPDGDQHLIFSFVGYLSREVAVGNKAVIDISLEVDKKSLEEVVVIGYGTQKKKDLTGAVGEVKQDRIKDLPVSSIDQKLVGQIAGVQIQQVSGAPGSGTSVKIRGNGSLGAGNEPLYVVDGVPYSSGLNVTINPLTFINPNDIESITILKDASSTAIYGSRGANGVIMITTKKGSEGVSRISYSSSIGVQTVPMQGRPQVLNAREFAEFQRDQIDYQVRLQAGREPVLADYPTEYQDLKALNGKGTDWYGLILQNGNIQDHNLLIQKGFKDSGLQLGLGYFEQEGVIQYTGLKRYTANIGYNFRLGEKFALDMSLKPAYIDQKRTVTGTDREADVTGISLWANPVLSPYDENGSLIPYLVTPPSQYGRANWNFPNPLFILRESKRNHKEFRNLGTLSLTWEPVNGLRISSNISSVIAQSKYNQYIPSTIGGANNPPSPGRGTASISNSSVFDWLFENTALYSKTLFKDHSINVLLGYSTQKSQTKGISLNAGPYANDLVQTLNVAPGITSWGENVDVWTMISYLGRLNYAYKSKYLMTATVRSDGSSRFGENNRFSVFPSVALAWRISDENFLKNIKSIDDLKIRFSYGKSGNNNIGNYSHLSTVSLGQYVFNNVISSGAAVSLYNPDLGWEEAKQIDFGVELALFKNRLHIVADYYKRRTNNMLMNDLIPAITGFTSQLVNKGVVQNSGLELTFGVKPLTGTLQWDLNFNIAFNRNKVLSTNENNDRILSGNSDGRASHVSMVGQPVGQFFGFILDGVYSQEEIDNPSVAKFPGAKAGNPKYRDLDGNGIIAELLDYTAIGNPHPKYIFGLSNRIEYKNFDLLINMNGQYGAKIMNGMRQTLDNIQGYFNIGKEWVNRWRNAENTGDGIHAGIPGLTHRVNDKLWVEDASYFRLTNITLGYRVPDKIASRLRIHNGLRLYLTSQNLFTYTRYSGPNPEGQALNVDNTLSPGFDMNSYPLSRVVSAGLNVYF